MALYTAIVHFDLQCNFIGAIFAAPPLLKIKSFF